MTHKVCQFIVDYFQSANMLMDVFSCFCFSKSAFYQELQWKFFENKQSFNYTVLAKV